MLDGHAVRRELDALDQEPWDPHLRRLRVPEQQHPSQLLAMGRLSQPTRHCLQYDREPDVLKPARTPEPASIGLTHSSPAGSRLWHVMGLQRRVQESAIPQGWARPVRQEQAQGILLEALGMLATPFGSEKAA
jgi:hypothetical protein